MAESKSKRDQMMELVLLSFSTPIEFLEDKYGIPKRTIYRWKNRLIKEGAIDPEILDLRVKSIAPSESITPEISHLSNTDLFTDEALKTRLNILYKMNQIITSETDLDKLTKALKTVNDVIDGALGGDNPIKKRNSIFEAAEIIEANMPEIIAKQKQLK